MYIIVRRLRRSDLNGRSSQWSQRMYVAAASTDVNEDVNKY